LKSLRDSARKNGGTQGVNRDYEVSGPKHKKNAPAGETSSQRQPRKKDRMIRLDDLIPKKDVLGGRMLFGASQSTQQINNNSNNPTQEN
jgi:hypothetical protein